MSENLFDKCCNFNFHGIMRQVLGSYLNFPIGNRQCVLLLLSKGHLILSWSHAFSLVFSLCVQRKSFLDVHIRDSKYEKVSIAASCISLLSSQPVIKVSNIPHLGLVQAGKLEKHVKSEDIPEDKSGPVTVVVGKVGSNMISDFRSMADIHANTVDDWFL